MAHFKNTLFYVIAICLTAPTPFVFGVCQQPQPSETTTPQVDSDTAVPKKVGAEEVANSPKRKKRKVVAAKKWFGSLQSIGRDHQKGETVAQTDVARKKLIEEITKKLSGSSIKFRTKVRGVQWRDGIAKVTTQLEFSTKVTKKTPLLIDRSQPFEIVMTQAEAAAIKPGDKFEFQGRLTFHARRWGAVGTATHSQQMYSLRHKYISGGYLGTFTSNGFECSIDGKTVVPRWAEKLDEKNASERLHVDP